MAPDGIDLIDEDDAGRVLLGLLEHVAHARGADADEHLDEVRSGDSEERHLRLAQLRHRCGRFSHLHERQDALLHAGAARSRHEDQRHAPFQGPIDGATDLFTDDRPHTAAHEPEIEDAQRHLAPIDRPLADDHGVFTAGLFLLRLDPVFIRAGILKLERVLRLQLGVPLFEGSEIHQQVDTFNHRNGKVIVALRTDLVVPVHLFAIHDLPAVITLQPHPLRHFGAFGRLCLLGFAFFKPCHLCSPIVQGFDPLQARSNEEYPVARAPAGSGRETAA